MTVELWQVFGLTAALLALYALFVHVPERKDATGRYWARGYLGAWRGRWHAYRVKRVGRG